MSIIEPYRTQLVCKKVGDSDKRISCSISKEKVIGAATILADNFQKAEIHEIRGGFTKGDSLGLVSALGYATEDFKEIYFFPLHSQEALALRDKLNNFARSNDNALTWEREEQLILGLPVFPQQIFVLLIVLLSVFWDYAKKFFTKARAPS